MISWTGARRCLNNGLGRADGPLVEVPNVTRRISPPPENRPSACARLESPRQKPSTGALAATWWTQVALRWSRDAGCGQNIMRVMAVLGSVAGQYCTDQITPFISRDAPGETGQGSITLVSNISLTSANNFGLLCRILFGIIQT